MAYKVQFKYCLLLSCLFVVNCLPGPSGLKADISTLKQSLLDSLDIELGIKTEPDDDEENSKVMNIKLEPITDNEVSNRDSSDDELPAAKKMCIEQPEKRWVFAKSFITRSQAKAYIKSDLFWKLRPKLCTDTIQYYQCNKAHNLNCKAACQLRFSASDKTEVYFSKAKHSCGVNNPKKRFKTTEAIKIEISKLYYDMKLKPLQILKHLAEKYEVPPTKKQITLCLDKLKQKARGQPSLGGVITLSFTELSSWIAQNNEVPIDMDTGFVLNSAIDVEKRSLRLAVSTKRLLKNALECGDLILHTNLAHKLLWYGYPVILVGMTDRNERFHLLAIAVCSDIKTEDFEFIFDSLKTNYQEIFYADLTPKVLVTDSTAAIQDSFRKVFPSCPVRICWNHMRSTVKNDQNHLPHINGLLEDLDFVQAIERDSFSKCVQLFLNKWSKQDYSFSLYFKSEWMDRNQGWYENFCPGTFSTNASLEWASHDLKIEHNIPEKLQPKRFCSLIKTIVESCSFKYKKSRITVEDAVTITTKMWTDAYTWYLMDKNLHCYDTRTFIEYIIPRGDHLDVDTSVVDAAATTFDEYYLKRSTYHKLYMPYDAQEWREGRCTCAVFLKTFMCKHLLGVAIKLGYVVTPREVEQRHTWKLKQQIKKSKTIKIKAKKN